MDSASGNGNGKSPSYDNAVTDPGTQIANFGSSKNAGGPNHRIVNVLPPKREDLQPSYAQTLGAEEDAGSHGWYGNMSESTICIPVWRYF